MKAIGEVALMSSKCNDEVLHLETIMYFLVAPYKDFLHYFWCYLSFCINERVTKIWC